MERAVLPLLRGPRARAAGVAARHARRPAGTVRWTHHWARATNSFQWSRAHSLELQSARTFFGMFPEFLIGVPTAGRRNPQAARLIGSPVPAQRGSVPTPAGPAASS
ncbi:hypothetical protein NKG94_27585 [Micromonospora sp. M12]